VSGGSSIVDASTRSRHVDHPREGQRERMCVGVRAGGQRADVRAVLAVDRAWGVAATGKVRLAQSTTVIDGRRVVCTDAVRCECTHTNPARIKRVATGNAREKSANALPSPDSGGYRGKRANSYRCFPSSDGL
jgi:hypothetical protein